MNPFKVERRYRTYAIVVYSLAGLSIAGIIIFSIVNIWRNSSTTHVETAFKEVLTWGHMPSVVICHPNVDDFVDLVIANTSIATYNADYSTWSDDKGFSYYDNLDDYMPASIVEHPETTAKCLVWDTSILTPNFANGQGDGNYLDFFMAFKFPSDAVWRALMLYFNDTKSGFLSQSVLLSFFPCGSVEGVATIGMLQKKRNKWSPTPCNHFEPDAFEISSLVSVSKYTIHDTPMPWTVPRNSSLQCLRFSLVVLDPAVTEIIKHDKCFCAMTMISKAGGYLSIITLLMSVAFVKKYPRSKAVIENELLTVPWNTNNEFDPEIQHKGSDAEEDSSGSALEG